MDKQAEKNQAVERRIERFLALNEKMRVQTLEAEQAFNEKVNYLSVPQLHAVLTIHRLANCTMSQLADELHMSRGSITQIIDKLIKLKLVKRKPSLEDRRVIFAELTAKGESVVELQKDSIREVCVQIFEKITAKEQEAFLDFFEKITG
jgi:DNA-binding MarR family transcriptional regulator